MMVRFVRLTAAFLRASALEDLAYPANFAISLLHTLLNFSTGVLGVVVLFSQIQTVNGWDLPAILALLGVYLTISALRGLFIGPSLEALVGMDGEVWTGRLDYTLLRPVDAQLLASVRHWRLFSIVDLVLGLGVVVASCARMGQALAPAHLLSFMAALVASVATLYAILLAFAGLVFWSPGFLFTWIFDAIMQMARYPTAFYPGWLRLVLTWVIPVGLMTTLPAQALTGRLSAPLQVAGLALAVVFVLAASLLFRAGLRRYAGASS